ncbi:MAG: hypothetical protein OSB43_08585, partial [Nocardioides sp.]|uniref:hypothetical protein n=1 Tax=Nocardioides sp. TaxID=35761 RepID=UPI002387C014
GHLGDRERVELADVRGSADLDVSGVGHLSPRSSAVRRRRWWGSGGGSADAPANALVMPS